MTDMLNDEKDIRAMLLQVYEALSEKGYDPINQISGYLLSGDPTYITNHKNARNLICRVDKDEFLRILIEYYLSGEIERNTY